MPDHLLACSCGQKVRVANAQAGGQVACNCGKLLSVPTLRGLRDLELAPPLEVAGKKPGWTRLQGITFVLGLLIAAVGLYLIAFYSWRYAQLTVQGSDWLVDRTDDVVRAQEAQINSMSAASLFDEWAKVKEEGLGEQSKPIWVTAKEQIARYVFRMQAGAAALIIGALLAIGALFLGPASTPSLS
jgi:hypothetical protein